MSTRALLRCGAAAGPLFIIAGLGQAFLRDGFDLGHNTLSLLSTGTLGWIQVLTFSLSGALHVGGAIGAAMTAATVLISTTMPLGLRFAASEKSHAWLYRYHIDWEGPLPT